MHAMTLVRYAVFALVALVAVAAFSALAIQRRTISPFIRLARTLRRVSDPLVKPMERTMLKRGGNPQNAPWWLLGLALVAGIVLISVIEWLFTAFQTARLAANIGGRATAVLVVDWTIRLLTLALMIRVIGSWFGADRFTKWMRPFYLATEWFLKPLRRVVPPFGPVDITPIVAWFLLSFVVGPLLIKLIV
jgi:YggT family protein